MCASHVPKKYPTVIVYIRQMFFVLSKQLRKCLNLYFIIIIINAIAKIRPTRFALHYINMHCEFWKYFISCVFTY